MRKIRHRFKPSQMTALQQQRKSIDLVSRKLWLAIISDMKDFVFLFFFFLSYAQTVSRSNYTKMTNFLHL